MGILEDYLTIRIFNALVEQRTKKRLKELELEIQKLKGETNGHKETVQSDIVPDRSN